MFKNLTFTLALIVAITLISSNSISVIINYVSTTEKQNLEEIKDETPIVIEPSIGLAPNFAVDKYDKTLVSLPFEEKMWGYIVNSSIFDEGTCYFDYENPSDIVYLHDTESDDFLSGGTGVCSKWIACENSTGALWKIDPETGDMTYIGGGGVGLNGLATDYTNNFLYGASGSGFYMIDPEDGAQEFIGDFGSGVNEMIGIACSWDGEMYGWDLGDKLWTINIETGEATEVGPLGVDLNYAQDGGFDEDGVLFLTAYIGSPYNSSYLCTCDIATGMCTVGDQIGGNSQITASVISLGGFCSSHDIGVKDIISPKDGYAGEELDVIVKVRNYGNNSENNVMVNVVISKNGVYEEYNETIYVDVGWQETIDVEMPKWTPDDWQNSSNEYIDYKIVASIELNGDENPDNDCKEKWIELYFGYFHDVGCTDILGPESGPAQTFKVNATIKNFGQYDECCFKTYVEIAEADLDSQVELLTEDFTDSTFPPLGWTRTHNNWEYSDTNNAGGSSGEARFYYSPESTDYFRLITTAIDTSDYDTVEIEFKQFIDHYKTPYSLQVETSEDGVNWDVVWEIKPRHNIGSKTITIFTGQNVGSTTYVSWTFNGYSGNIDNWYVDDIVINGYNSFYPEYKTNQCIMNIDSGDELELEFDVWTPEFLVEEISNNKIYSVKAWTDLDDPPDENPDNDLFIKSIILDFFHDVAIREIISPFQSGSGVSTQWWYAVASNYFVRWYPWTGEVEYIGPAVCFPQGGTFVEDEWWICDSNGEIYIVDTETGDVTHVGNSNTGGLVSLAYNLKDKVLYGMSTSAFFEIDQDTGAGTLIGSLGVSTLMISCAANADGVMYSYDLGFGTANTYTIDLETGKATILGPTGLYLNYGQDMAYDFQTDKMYAAAFNYNTFQGELHEIDMETGAFTYITGPLPVQTTCLAIPYTNLLFPEGYVPLGSHDIEVIVENIGTFPELNLTCYAEIYEYITNCTNGTLVYENNITDIDLDEPLGGNKTLKFDSYNFATEGLYELYLNITDNNDDYPNNNEVMLGIGVDDTPPVSNQTIDPETPDGDNGWYVNDLDVILYAKDPSIGCGLSCSGVKEIKYTIDGVGYTIPGRAGTFTITHNGNDIFVEYWAIDWVGNVESKNSFTIDMDQTKPNVNVIWDAYRKGLNWYVKFTCEADDETSGMGQVEMYIDNELHETITRPGPTYEFDIKWLDEFNTSNFKFVAFDKAGNSAFNLIEGSDIKSYSYSKIYSHQSIKIWAQMWLDRFILINKFFRWLI